MIEREKVMRGAECCTKDVDDPCSCKECPYLGHKPTQKGCITVMLEDTLALLKEKEPVEATEKQKEFAVKFGITVPQYWCGECHYMLVYLTRFCPNCGKKVKWDA